MSYNYKNNIEFWKTKLSFLIGFKKSYNFFGFQSKKVITKKMEEIS